MGDQQVSPSLLGERVLYYTGKAGHGLNRESRWSLEEQNDTCLSKEGTQMQANNNKKKLFLDELRWTKQM